MASSVHGGAGGDVGDIQPCDAICVWFVSETINPKSAAPIPALSAETHARLVVQVIIPFRSPPPWSFGGQRSPRAPTLAANSAS